AVPANATISGFSILPSTGDAYAVNVDIRNNSVETLRQQISLTLNDRAIAGHEILLEAGEAATVNFADLNAAGDLVRGQISLLDDALPLDNQVRFIYSSKQQVPVLIIESQQPRVNQFLYIEKALRLSRKPLFSVSRLAWHELKVEDLANWAVIIINDVAMPGDEIRAALQQYVESGGALLVASGDNIQSNWPSGEDGFMPGMLMSRIDAKAGQSNSLPQFSDEPGLVKSIDLSSASIFAYRKLRANENDRVLARFSGGDVALIERRSGPGRVLLLTTTLDMIWNDMAVQPGFVPFLHQTVSYLSAYEPYADRFEVGDVVDVLAYARALAGAEALVADDDLPLVVETPDGSEILLRRQAPLLKLAQPGFYQIHRATRADAKVFLAVNINAQEAGLERLDVAQFVEQISDLAEAPVSAAALTQRQAEAYEQQQQLWFTILVVALLIMLVEAFSANWIVRKRPAAP
ncbi:MAG: hypothetical protein HKN34_07820, partial [Gammaproteobacteria bacterium]|nr:hypothetical protein [Gammaproteobacteria bacterium]